MLPSPFLAYADWPTRARKRSPGARVREERSETSVTSGPDYAKTPDPNATAVATFPGDANSIQLVSELMERERAARLAGWSEDSTTSWPNPT